MISLKEKPKKVVFCLTDINEYLHFIYLHICRWPVGAVIVSHRNRNSILKSTDEETARERERYWLVCVWAHPFFTTIAVILLKLSSAGVSVWFNSLSWLPFAYKERLHILQYGIWRTCSFPIYFQYSAVILSCVQVASMFQLHYVTLHYSTLH